MKRILLGVLIAVFLEVAAASVGYVWWTTRADDALETVTISKDWLGKLFRERIKMKDALDESLQKQQELQQELYLQDRSRRA